MLKKKNDGKILKLVFKLTRPGFSSFFNLMFLYTDENQTFGPVFPHPFVSINLIFEATKCRTVYSTLKLFINVESLTRSMFLFNMKSIKNTPNSKKQLFINDIIHIRVALHGIRDATTSNNDRFSREKTGKTP